MIELMEEEGLTMNLMGAECIMKMMEMMKMLGVDVG